MTVPLTPGGTTPIAVTLSLGHLTRRPSLPSPTFPLPLLLHLRTFPLLLPHLPLALLLLPHLSSLICRRLCYCPISPALATGQRRLYYCPISLCQSPPNPQSQPPLGTPHTNAKASFLSIGCFFLHWPSQFLPTSSSPSAIPVISHYSRCNPTAAALPSLPLPLPLPRPIRDLRLHLPTVLPLFLAVVVYPQLQPTATLLRQPPSPSSLLNDSRSRTLGRCSTRAQPPFFPLAPTTGQHRLSRCLPCSQPQPPPDPTALPLLQPSPDYRCPLPSSSISRSLHSPFLPC
ncbi:hypothetical protein B296_00029685 [Ensete ventricosum]|uniref:Uncharacterized protein n=1 Tax=Ensete ventricosum TaxID=4639 RepID=A0A426XES0_ENSVE|nr:hypothetical protein B296_00029685 [Ensete ventricosum]